jgi:hypothetical protein
MNQMFANARNLTGHDATKKMMNALDNVANLAPDPATDPNFYDNVIGAGANVNIG